MKHISLPLLFVCCLGGLFAQTGSDGVKVPARPALRIAQASNLPDFIKGEELFLRNKPAEALPYLEKACAAEPANTSAGLYLATVYEQLRRIDDAIAVYRRILPAGGEYTALIAFNLGNAYFNKGTAVFAEQYYTRAVEADPGYAPAYLNRANTRLKTGAIKEALLDYELYLAIEPASPKRPQIERLISLIDQETTAEERRKQAAEAAVKAEAERRKRLLDEVSASLQAAAEATKGIQAESENASGYTGEFELE